MYRIYVQFWVFSVFFSLKVRKHFKAHCIIGYKHSSQASIAAACSMSLCWKISVGLHILKHYTVLQSTSWVAEAGCRAAECFRTTQYCCRTFSKLQATGFLSLVFSLMGCGNTFIFLSLSSRRPKLMIYLLYVLEDIE